MDVYGECLMRSATTNGIILLTFTPLRPVRRAATLLRCNGPSYRVGQDAILEASFR